MRMRMRKVAACAAALLILLGGQASALNDTIGVTAGSGKTANLIKFGSNNVISEVGICDAATENQCASVDGTGALKVTGVGLANSAAIVGGTTGSLGMCDSLLNPASYSNSTANFIRCTLTGATPTVPDYGTPVAAQSAATSSTNGTAVTVLNYQTVLVDINCTVACSGGTTINFEGSDQQTNGAGFTALKAMPLNGGSCVNTAITTGQFLVNVSGLQQFRARISGWSAGTVYVWVTPFAGAMPVCETPALDIAVRGTFSSTDGSAHNIIAAQGAGTFVYVRSVQCSNSSATDTVVTFNDSASTPIYVPTKSGNNPRFDPPLKVAANTAFTMTANPAETTVTCNAQGWFQ